MDQTNCKDNFLSAARVLVVLCTFLSIIGFVSSLGGKNSKYDVPESQLECNAGCIKEKCYFTGEKGNADHAPCSCYFVNKSGYQQIVCDQFRTPEFASTGYLYVLIASIVLCCFSVCLCCILGKLEVTTTVTTNNITNNFTEISADEMLESNNHDSLLDISTLFDVGYSSLESPSSANVENEFVVIS